MFIYFFQLLLFFSYTFIFILLSKSKNKSSIIFFEKLYVVIVIIQFTLFSGLRSATVGTDTQMYVNSYISNFSIDDNTYTYNFLRIIVWWLSRGNYHVFLVSIAFLTTYCIVCGIYRLGFIFNIHNKIKFIFLSVANYILYNFYLATFNTARQFLAVAICFFAVTYLLEHKYTRYFILEVLAIGVHNTAIFTIVFLVVFLLEKYINIILLIFIAFLMSYFSIPLIQILTHYSSHYELYTAASVASMSSNGGMLLIGLFFVIVNITSLVYLKKEKFSGNFFICIYIAILGGLMYIVGMKSQMLLRIALYASIFNVVSLPIATYSLTKKITFNYRNLNLNWLPDLIILFIGIGIYFYMVQINLNGIVPYSLS